MNKLYKTKQIFIIILIIIIVVAIFISIKPKKESATKENGTPVAEEIKPVELCYYRTNKTSSEFYDIAWIKLSILGDKITGEFRNLPAESDSKIGTFEGTVGPLEQKIMGRRANVWWDSRAEGMEVKEELEIIFGDGSATVGFGEMVDRGDGVYLYKDKTNLYYIDGMWQMGCEDLDEKLFTEKYIRENIKTVATNKPVLGGSWYVISVMVNSTTNTGDVVFEDGHIQSKANFTYTYEENPQNITVTKFEIK